MTITGKLHAGDDQYLTVRALDLGALTRVGDVILAGADAAGSGASGARSSYVVHARNTSGLTLERVTLQAGNGADGEAGTAGEDGHADSSYLVGENGADGDAAPAPAHVATCNHPGNC